MRFWQPAASAARAATKGFDAGSDRARGGETSDSFLGQELSDRVEADAPGRLVVDENVVAAFERDETRAGDAGGDLAALPRGESFDFVDRMAARVPAEMIASILGLPTAEVPYFAGRVYQLARAVQPIYPHADHEDIEAAAAELFDYVEAHMRARMATPRDDLLSTVVASWRSDQAISFESLVLQVLAIVVGGSDTTRAAFAMLVALLLERPEDWAALQADPALIPGAVAEGLRYEPSVASISRFTKTPIEIGSAAVPAGVALSVSTLSAMRDPALYADPDRFDIRRTDHPRLHLVFGMGPHRCIGEMLARIELEEGLAALIEAGLEIEMETRPSMRGFGGIRQITPLQARIR